MRVLVTGSSGTVGTALVQELLSQGIEVIPVDIKSSLWDKKINQTTVLFDLRKPLRQAPIKRPPDMIIHLAANARVHDLVVKPQLALDNYVMTHNLLEYAREKGVKRFLFASSREVYGESRPNAKRKEEAIGTLVNTLSPYTASKFGSEALVHAYHECYGIEPVIVRLSNVYGRYDVSERVIPFFIYAARRNRDLTIFGKEKKLDFTYTDDAIDGLVACIKRFDRVSGMTFNLSCGKGERLVDLAEMIIDQLGSKSKVLFDNKRTGEISAYVGDLAVARKHLSYEPKVLLKDGLVRNIAWYLEAVKRRRVYDIQRRILAARGWA